jgi:demethylmenaquinone methyltransferase / 2-methoxy-6-polyprenyl-1,4-benzoquinol methylase
MVAAVSVVLPGQAEKPRYVAEMFGRIASRYDLMNTLMTAGQDQRWRRMVARLATRQHSERVLDLGTGTGRLAEAILEARPTAHVVGLDFTEAMLRRASHQINPTCADALHLPFADDQFDAVVSAFLVRNLSSVAEGINEQVRVLRPGGRLVVLETTPGPPGPIGRLCRLYFRLAVPTLGRLIARDAAAYTYLPESTLAFLEPPRLASTLAERGLVDVRTRLMALGCVAITSARKAARMPSPRA